MGTIYQCYHEPVAQDADCSWCRWVSRSDDWAEFQWVMCCAAEGVLDIVKRL
jgi:hypothetical protein